MNKKVFLELIDSSDDLHDEIKALEYQISNKREQIKKNMIKSSSDIYIVICRLEAVSKNKFIGGLKEFYEKKGFFTIKQLEAFFTAYDYFELKNICEVLIND